MILREVYEEAINYIEELEEQFDIFLDKEMFVNKTLPCYFYISIYEDQGETKISYNFEVYEGSAQINCIYLGQNNLEILDANEILIEHLEEF
tara:strand:- start:515 stop:790 length:276 start_codon:yes stop_codon:yes gene_type:complete